MVNFDYIDYKILYELKTNSRESYAQIGRKVKISKQSVKNRIEKLVENSIIHDFHTYVNTGYLNIIPLRFHLIYQYRTSELEKKFLNYFKNNKFSTIIALTQGAFDLSVSFQFRKLSDFFQTWIEIQNTFGTQIKENIISFPLEYSQYDPIFMLKKDNNESLDRKPIIINFYKKNNLKIDELDLKMLKLLSDNSRIKILDIARECKITEKSVKNRLKNLLKNKVICGYSININYEKLGYHFFRVYIYLRKYQQRNHIISYLQNIPYLTSIDTIIGESHIEIDLILKNISQLYKIMQEIANNFPDQIINYKYAIITKLEKLLYFPSLSI